MACRLPPDEMPGLPGAWQVAEQRGHAALPLVLCRPISLGVQSRPVADQSPSHPSDRRETSGCARPRFCDVRWRFRNRNRNRNRDRPTSPHSTGGTRTRYALPITDGGPSPIRRPTGSRVRGACAAICCAFLPCPERQRVDRPGLPVRTCHHRSRGR